MLPVTLLTSFKILTQPDDSTCGPTSLHAVYQYYNDLVPLDQVISEVSFLEDGGTLGVMLGCHALRRGYKAKIYTYNLQVFDPTWFKLEKDKLIANLREQMIYKADAKLHVATHAYIEFLELGGELLYKDLTSHLLDSYFSRNIPLLSGLSATYLYNCARERTNDRGEAIYDDVRGEALGHFVVLAGFDNEQEKEHVIVADPYQENPLFGNNYYNVPLTRLINSIMLGIVTYDANLLVIEPSSNPTNKTEQNNLHA